MDGKPKKGWSLLLTFTLCHNWGHAQNTDGELRVDFYQFTLTLSPASTISCNTATAETVRNVAEDCLQAFAPNSCDGLFPSSVGLPEQILLGGAECRDDDTVLVKGGAMDFSVRSAMRAQVDECVLLTFGGSQCFSYFQNVFPILDGLTYSVDTPQPTVAPSPVPSASPTAKPTATPSLPPTPLPTVSPTLQPTALPTTAPSATPSLRPSIQKTAEPSSSPAPSRGDGVKGSIVEDETQPLQGSDGRNSLGIYVGAAACGLCLLLLLLLFVSKRRRRVEEASKHVRELPEDKETKQAGLHNLDSLHPQPVPPPPGILHNNSPHTAPRAQSRLFHSLPDDDYSAPGTSIGDPDLTLISSVDMGSTDGSESFVDHNRSLSVNISKDMLGGSSEVPKNRNAVLSRLGATLTPALVLSSSSDDGDSPPSPASKKKSGFYRLQDDEDDGADEELLLEIRKNAETNTAEDFAPDTDWDPDDSEVAVGGADAQDMFKDRKSPACADDPEADVTLPMPPELKNSTRRKRSGTPRNILGGSDRKSPAMGSSSSASSG